LRLPILVFSNKKEVIMISFPFPSKVWARILASIFLLFITIGLSACDSSGPNLSETCPGGDCLKLSVSKDCETKFVKGSVENPTNATEWKAFATDGALVDSGKVGTDGVFDLAPNNNGDLDIKVSDNQGKNGSARTDSESISYDCETKPSATRLDNKTCSNGDDGSIDVINNDGIEPWTLFEGQGDNKEQIRDGDNDGETTLSLSDLSAGRYTIELTTSEGFSDTARFTIPECEQGPGSGSIRSECPDGGGPGSGDVYVEFENSTTKIELLADGEVVSVDEDGADAGEEVEFEDQDNRTYTARGTGQSGETRETGSTTLNCEEPGPGDFSVGSECDVETGIVTISSDEEYDTGKLYLEGGDVLTGQPNGDGEVVFDNDVPDGDHEAAIVRNSQESSREDVTVQCDFAVRECKFVFSAQLNGDAKTDEYSLGTKTILDRDPIRDAEFEIRNVEVDPDAAFVLQFKKDGNLVYESDEFSRGDLSQTDVPTDFVDTQTQYEAVVKVTDGGSNDFVVFDEGRVIIRYKFRGSDGKSNKAGTTRTFTIDGHEPF
jgi:hypothetical protein